MARPPFVRRSLAGRAAVALAAIALVVTAAALAFARVFDSPLLAALAALLVATPLIAWLATRLTSGWSRVITAVTDGITSLKDRDFSISVTHVSDDEVGDLANAYNSLGDTLRRERLDLYQRELLLDTVVQTTPLALVLTNATGAVVFGNIAARQLFQQGRKLEGHDFGELLAGAPQPLRDAVAAGTDTLFGVELGHEAEIFHLAQRNFTLNGQPHRLLLFKQLTRELAAQEVAIWKKVIRVIAHELNNSLAPITSLAHSGLQLAQAPDPERLTRVFATIEERATHLASFIDGYARFAKLPRPRPVATDWAALLAGLADTARFRLDGALPDSPGWLDPAQVEQVIINLLKNAAESGSPPEEITVAVHERPPGFAIEVADRGTGLADEVLRDALLPFYSTKPKGTGLGLTLCREIVEAHGGRLSIANREGGGAIVSLWLPGPPAAALADGEASPANG
jgi:two-component system nitrogen regulation sensor histidine kinase NtrY